LEKAKGIEVTILVFMILSSAFALPPSVIGGNADVLRGKNLEPSPAESNNADFSRNRNLQSALDEPNNADLSRSRNFQAFELEPPQNYSLVVNVVNSSNLPVEDAVVTVANFTGSTDSNGSISFDIPFGTYDVLATHPDYNSTSWRVDLDSDKNTTLILSSPYNFVGEISDADIIITPTDSGYDISLLDVFQSSPCDVFFDWNYVGTLLNGTVSQTFAYNQLPSIVIEAAQKGSHDYPKARSKYLVPIALTPLTGNEGAFLEEPVPYAAASIFIIPDPPVMGKPAILGVFLHNPFNQSLHVSRIDFQVSGLTIGALSWRWRGFTSVGYVSDVTLQPGQISSYNVTWVADVTGHHCVKVVLTYSPTTQQLQKNLDIETDIAPGTLGSAYFSLQNPTPTPQNLKLKVNTDCPATWSIHVVVNGKDYDVSPGKEPPTIPNFPSGKLSAFIEVQYPPGEGLSSHKIDIEGYVGDTLVGGVRKIVVPSEVIPVESIGTSFTPEENGFPFDNWGYTIPILNWPFGGNCLGMSYVAWNRWHFHKPLPQNEIVAKGIIVGFQSLSMVADVFHNVAVQIANNLDRNDLIRSQYETTYNNIANGKATMLVLTQEGGGGAHAVVAYKVQDVGNGIKYIYVYDPNFSFKTHSGGDWNKKIIVRNDGSSWTMSYNNGISYDAFGVVPEVSLDEIASSLTVQGFSDYDLHLYDHFGNHSGFNYVTNETEQQIANSSYNGLESEPQTIAVFNPYNGTYTIHLIGKNNSAFHVAVQTFDLFASDGLVNSEYWLNGTILQNQTIEYTILIYRDTEGKLRAKTGDIHEIGITGIESSKTVVGQGSHVSLSVTLRNYGSFTESFNLTVYANSTKIQKSLATLAGMNQTTMTFDWNTTGSAKGNYTFWAYAEPVQGETDTTDNLLTGGIVKVTIVGDVNGDGKVNLIDVFKEALAYGSVSGDSWWDPNLDINNDGKINLIDYFITALNYGKTDP